MININILFAVVVLGGIGALLGLMLGVASKCFAIEKDPRLDAIADALPGANCGACGFAGCGAYAEKVLEGVAVNKCSVGGVTVAEKLAEIMGTTAGEIAPMTARVKCVGNKDVAVEKYIYQGNFDCFSANAVSGGPKSCTDGCIGYGSCVNVCQFDAISVVNGVAVVDEEKCTACGACVAYCPKKVISMTRKDVAPFVLCNNHDKGVVVKEKCASGCIACGICVKACENDAITLVNNVAVIDPEKCIKCGKCVEKCPKKVIKPID